MSRIVWTAASFDDLRRLRAFIGKDNQYAAARVAAALIATGESLTHFPTRGRLVAGTAQPTRELIADHGYIVRYRIIGEMVLVLRVRHGARRPLKR